MKTKTFNISGLEIKASGIKEAREKAVPLLKFAIDAAQTEKMPVFHIRTPRVCMTLMMRPFLNYGNHPALMATRIMTHTDSGKLIARTDTPKHSCDVLENWQIRVMHEVTREFPNLAREIMVQTLYDPKTQVSESTIEGILHDILTTVSKAACETLPPQYQLKCMEECADHHMMSFFFFHVRRKIEKQKGLPQARCPAEDFQVLAPEITQQISQSIQKTNFIPAEIQKAA